MSIIEINAMFKDGAYKDCAPIHSRKKDMYEFAEKAHGQICDLLKVPSTASTDSTEIFDPSMLVKEMGGEINFLSVDSGFEGGILIHDKNEFDVIVPDHTTPVRDRFTIMHEIGHYVLHAPGLTTGKKYQARRGGEGHVEQEANWFAAGVLMPIKKLGKLMEKYHKKFQNYEDSFRTEPMRQHCAQVIADDFLVSLPAAYFRLLTYQKDGY